MYPKILVISLPHAMERRDSIGAQFKSQGVDFEFIDAVYGKELTQQELGKVNIPLLKHYRRPFAPNEAGCYLSHGKAYKKIVDEKIPLALILEDDALLKVNLIKLFSSIEKFETPWELINIGSIPKKSQNCYIKERKDDLYLVEYPYKEIGAHAYLVKLSAAEKLLNDWQSPYRAADLQMSFIWRNKIKGYYYLMPNQLNLEVSLPSAITAERDEINVKTSNIKYMLNLGYLFSSVLISLHWKVLLLKTKVKFWTGQLKKWEGSDKNNK